MARALAVCLAGALTLGCGGEPTRPTSGSDDPASPAGAGSTAPAPDSGEAAGTATGPEPTPSAVAYADPPAARVDRALRRELLAMLRRDQAARTEPAGASADETDQDRTDRLAEIVAEQGWPGWDLVGRRGEEAAWAIAQHSDLDPAFQAVALAHLRGAVEAGRASPGNLAYLEDRVAVGAGREQAYGTQVGCGPEGPEPATPLRDPDAVEDLRAEAGLPSLADYLAEMEEVCAASE